MHAATFSDFTTVSTTQDYPLGEERREYDSTYGWRTYRYVKNDDAAAAFALGNLVVTDAGAEFYNGKISDVAGVPEVRALGVAQGVVAIDSYCWVICKGKCICLGDGSVAAGETVAAHTGGAFDTWAAGEGGMGVALTDDAAVTLLFTGFVNV